MTDRDAIDVNAIRELLAQAKFMKRRGMQYADHVERAYRIHANSLGRSATIDHVRYAEIGNQIAAAR